MSAYTSAPRQARIARVIVNRYAGTCNLCRNRVGEGEGVAFRDDAGGRWITQHNADQCPPPAAPRAAGEAPKQPAIGYYIREDGSAIKVVESKRLCEDGVTHRVYGLVFTPHPKPARPTWDYIKGAGLSVAHMRPMTATDAAQLGLSHGHCINCCAPLGGETLTAHVSALIGYGETCAANNGWPYPKGVAAQRAFIAEREDQEAGLI